MSFYAELEDKAANIEIQLSSVIQKYPVSFARVGSMFTLFFRSEPPTDFDEVKQCDFELFGQFHRRMLERGVYFPPSQYEAVFLSNAVSSMDIDHLVRNVDQVLAELFSA